MSGAPRAFTDALKALRPGGRISVLGIYPAPFTVDVTDRIVFNCSKIYGINGRLIFGTWEKTRELLENKLVDPSPVITHRMKLEEFEKGFELLEEQRAGKIVLLP